MDDTSNLPLSEQFRLTARQWAEADNAARMLEESKTTVLSQRMAALGDMPVAHAERTVKASPDWAQYIRQMVDERSRANLLKVEVEYIKMRFAEQQSQEANSRAERRL